MEAIPPLFPVAPTSVAARYMPPTPQEVSALYEVAPEHLKRVIILRHGFATEAIAAGADYGTVAALMGHKSPMMVLKHYQHVKNAQKVAVMEQMPQIVFRGDSVCPNEGAEGQDVSLTP